MMTGETVGGGPLVSVGREVKTMIETMIVALFLGLMMAKKKETRKFGQMTLNMGGQALEYLKGTAKPLTRELNRVVWANKHHLGKTYELPQWVHPTNDENRSMYPKADKYQDVAIVYSVDPSVMPLLVYQPSALRGLDECLALAQEDGALVEDDGKTLVLDMGDGFLEISFTRNPKGGQFAPFIVRLKH